MQELDLDELDQAVNKLMTGGPKAKPKSDAPQKDAPAATAVADDDSAQQDDTAVPVTVRRTSLDIEPRKRGIAMDIVQNKPAVPPAPSAKPARTAPTLLPTNPNVEPEPPAPRETAEPPKTADVSDDTLASLNMQQDGHLNADESEDMAPKSDFPDPLDVHGFKDDDETAKRADDEDAPAAAEPKPAEEQTMHHEVAQVAPPDGAEEEIKAERAADDAKQAADREAEADSEPSSPFVTTKVEKRPLGAFADKPAPASDPSPSYDTSAEPPADDKDKIMQHGDAKLETQVKDGASIPVQETPKELSPEVVAVESAEPEFTANQTEAADTDDKGDMNELRQMAIPQQYQAETKPPSEEDRPVFDTKVYHPPINPDATPPVKSSKVGLVVSIIFILLMVVAAALAYFAVTGSIDLTRLW